MGLLNELGKGQGYFKGGFLGFQGSGKTYTAMLVALGLRQAMQLSGPVAMFDTEGGSEYIAAKVLKETGKPLVGVKSQAFQDLLTVGQECLQQGIPILLVDSATHIWRELCSSYLAQVNEARKKKNLYPRKKLEFQDWGPIKDKWAEWTNFYLNAPLHIIICGRAGYEYDYEINEESKQRELVKTGIRMKTEGEFGFEPSLLIEMERVQVPEKDGGFKFVHRATVLKDRFAVIDGRTEDDPTFAFFQPHIAMLTPGANAPIDTAAKTDFGVDEAGDAEFQQRRNRQKIAWESVENGLKMIFPASTGKDQQARFSVLSEVFGTTSETQIQKLAPDVLEHGARTIGALSARLLAPDADGFATLIELKQIVKELHLRDEAPATAPRGA